MEFTGKFVGLSSDVIRGTVNITFSVNEKKTILDNMTMLEDAEKLKITVSKHHKKRSLDANAYYWVILTKLAEKLNISKTELHNRLLQDYGQIEKDDSGQSIIFSIKSEIDISRRYDIYAKPIGTGTVNGKEFTHYVLLKGSHTYDSREMSVLINGLIYEAKLQGIETLPPDELERMLKAWRPKK